MTKNTANNIVVFPREHANPDNIHPKTIEDVDNTVEMVQNYHIQEMIEQLMPTLFDNMSLFGIHIDEDNVEDFNKDCALVSESVRSLLSKYKGIEHPLQYIAEGIFDIYEDEEGAGVVLADNLKIDIGRTSETEDTKETIESET